MSPSNPKKCAEASHAPDLRRQNIGENDKTNIVINKEMVVAVSDCMQPHKTIT